MSTEIVTTVDAKEYGIEPKKANELIGNLPQIQSERNVLQEQYNEVIKLDIDEKDTPKIAKELRLKILKNRTQGIGTWHKTTKDYFLKGGQFVDAIKRKEEAINVQMEETLEAIEKHAENKEKERIAKLQSERLVKIEPYLENTFGLDLGSMSDEMFDNFLLGAKTNFEAKQEAIRLENERIENERKLDEQSRQRQIEIAPYMQFVTTPIELRLMDEIEYSELLTNCKQSKVDFDDEQEKVRLENEKLKKEAEEKELELAKERKAEQEKQAKIQAENDAKLKTEREAREKLENEKKQLEDAKAKEKLEQEKLAKAPVKKQLSVWVNSFELPSTNVDNDTTKEVLAKFEAFKKWSLQQIDNL